MNNNRYKMTEIHVLDLKREGINTPILDVGGGGEGVIGQLYGNDVIAIDIREDELLETTNNAIKIVMDATDLKFVPKTFGTVFSFFTLMYMDYDCKYKTLKEIHRVMKDDGKLVIYDTEIPALDNDIQDIFVLQLKYKIDNVATKTGYGCKISNKKITFNDYLVLLEDTGYRVINTSKRDNVFKIEASKRDILK